MENIDGLNLYPNFLTDQEEKDLLNHINEKSWDLTLSRRTQHYNYRYIYKYARTRDTDYKLEKITNNPWLCNLITKIFNKYDITDIDFNKLQVIINEYKPGQCITAHVDDINIFGDIIFCVSLGASAKMVFTKKGSAIQRIQILNKTLYSMKGPARNTWAHAMVPDRNQLGTRYSITIRLMKNYVLQTN